jgi:hypothetical protein
LGWPEKEAVIRPLGAKSTEGAGKIRKVDLLGIKGNLKWTQANDALRIGPPPQKPCDYAVTFKIHRSVTGRGGGDEVSAGHDGVAAPLPFPRAVGHSRSRGMCFLGKAELASAGDCQPIKA